MEYLQLFLTGVTGNVHFFYGIVHDVGAFFVQVVDDLIYDIRSNGGSIPGIRPGKPTSDYIKKILNRITTLGAIFLIVVAGIPMIIGAAFSDFATLATFGGSSLLIVVGVALETTHDIEAQMTMRNYKGFLD